MIWEEKDLICSNTCFPWHNVLRQKGEICLKSIILAVNHCFALLRYVLRVVVWMYEKLISVRVLRWHGLVKLPFFVKKIAMTLNSSLNLIFMKKSFSWYSTSVHPAKSVVKKREYHWKTLTSWNVTELNGDCAGWPYHINCFRW